MKMSRIIIAEKAEQCHNVTRGVGINCSKLLLNNTVRGIRNIEVLWVRFPSFHGRNGVFTLHGDWQWNWNQWVLQI